MINFKESSLPAVTQEEMQHIYQRIKTPIKRGAVIKWNDYFTDSPTIFKKDDKFYMYFVAISKDCNISGYETHLATSEDLLQWDYVGTIFRRNEENHWDSKQCGGYAAFIDNTFGGSNEPQLVNDSYYISYLAGNSAGYEPDPLFMGMAKSTDPTNPDGFTRFPQPILRPDDKDCRPYEEKTLYKSFMFEDKRNVTGYKYINAYNAKANDDRERIYLAVSNDGEHWERYGHRAVIVFFRYEKEKPAYNTFACSRDLVHWTIWNGEPLIHSEYDWEDVHAHKTWFLRHNEVNYHFYCAVNSKNERFIALATS